jgi:hypothetical protein
MRCYSKTEMGWFKDFDGRDISSAAVEKGVGFASAGRRTCTACSTPGDPIFFGEKEGPRQRPEVDATHL